MPEPQIYNAAAEALIADRAKMRDYVPSEKQMEERDPIWNFEHIPSALQEQTDLRAWLTRQKDVRMELVRGWIRQLAKREGEDPTAHTQRRNRIRRCLLFVIGTEAAPLGSREIAAEAFKGIFPKE